MILFCQEVITCTILIPARLVGYDVTQVLNASDHMHDRDPTMKVCNTFPYHPSRSGIHIVCTYVDRVRVGCSTFIRELHTSTIHIWDWLEIQTEGEFRNTKGSGVMGLITIITSFHFGSWRCALSFPFFLHCPLYGHVHMARCWCPSVCLSVYMYWSITGMKFGRRGPAAGRLSIGCGRSLLRAYSGRRRTYTQRGLSSPFSVFSCYQGLRRLLINVKFGFKTWGPLKFYIARSHVVRMYHTYGLSNLFQWIQVWIAPCTRTRPIEKIIHKYVFPFAPSSWTHGTQQNWISK